MDLDGYSSTIVVYTYLPLYPIDNHLNGVHIFITLLVVGSVDKYLVKYLIQARNETDFSHLHRIRLRIIHPHLLLAALY